MKLTNNFAVLPNTSCDVFKLLRDSGRTSEEAIKTISTTGVSSFRSAHPKSLTDFIFNGLAYLNEKHKFCLEGTDAIIVVSQSFDHRIPSISTRIQGKLNLRSDAFCIDIMDGCAGFIKALSLSSMLEMHGFNKVLVVAGDLNSVMTNQADIGTRVLFGDGISICTLEADGSKIDTRLYNSGDLNNVISCSFSENVMHMNGFEVFRFTRNFVPGMINAYLEEKDAELASYDLVALHQASKLVVSTIFNSLKYRNTIAEDFSCGEIGNIGAGSIGAWLAKIEGLEKRGALKTLAVGFGAGLSWGLASLNVDVKKNEVIYV